MSIVFLRQTPYFSFMNQKLLFLGLPLFLTGCIGSIIGGHEGNIYKEFPDIRTVPERAEATKDRGLHEGSEKSARATAFQALAQEREKMKARDQALRERAETESEPVSEE